MITREQVADLRAGDVVELTRGDNVSIRGRLNLRRGELFIGNEWRVRQASGECRLPRNWSLLVISRAPRPLYVNHDRTEPVPGDVARNAYGDTARVWIADASGDWWTPHNGTVYMQGRSLSELGINLPPRLRLLVDGETGQVVPQDGAR